VEPAGAARARISSRHNPLARAAHELHTAAGRREQRAFLAEGIKLVLDALATGARPSLAFVAPELLERRPEGARVRQALAGTRVVETTPELLRWIGDVETTQGVVVVFPLPEGGRTGPAGHLLVVLDNLQDPGNVGTILRSMLASGLVSTVVVRGGADPYGPKAVRAAAAALFRLRVIRPTDEELAVLLAGRPVWLAEAGTGTPYDRVDWRAPSALVVGSEAHGPSEPVRRLATGSVHIPMRGPVESLNAAVAASIIAFEAAQQVAAATTA
jgi:TrmH family RNA methyltransferase